MADYTMTAFLKAVKLKSFAPRNQITFEDSDIIDIANGEMVYKVVPFIMSFREEFFVTYQDIPLVANQSEYDIPVKALGVKLRDVQVVDTVGYIKSLPRIEPEHETAYNYSAAAPESSCFTVEANKIKLFPTPSASNYKLRLKYFLTPNNLVNNTACAKIESIDTLTNKVIVSSLPSTISLISPVDIVASQPNFKLLSDNVHIIGINSTELEFSSLPSGLAVGDYISLTGESCVPMIPKETHNLLVQCVVSEILESLGDIEKLKVSQKKEEEIKDSLKILLGDRVEGENRKIINYASTLRSKKSRFYY